MRLLWHLDLLQPLFEMLLSKYLTWVDRLGELFTTLVQIKRGNRLDKRTVSNRIKDGVRY
jgi:hypothetical protein